MLFCSIVYTKWVKWRHYVSGWRLAWIIYNHGITEYRGIFPRYLPWHKISGTAQHYLTVLVSSSSTVPSWLYGSQCVRNNSCYDDYCYYYCCCCCWYDAHARAVLRTEYALPAWWHPAEMYRRRPMKERVVQKCSFRFEVKLGHSASQCSIVCGPDTSDQWSSRVDGGVLWTHDRAPATTATMNTAAAVTLVHNLSIDLRA